MYETIIGVIADYLWVLNEECGEIWGILHTFPMAQRYPWSISRLCQFTSETWWTTTPNRNTTNFSPVCNTIHTHISMAKHDGPQQPIETQPTSHQSVIQYTHTLAWQNMMGADVPRNIGLVVMQCHYELCLLLLLQSQDQISLFCNKGVHRWVNFFSICGRNCVDFPNRRSYKMDL